MKIKIWFKWIFYWWLTMEERHLYEMGKSRGMHCVRRKDVSSILPGRTYEYCYITGVEPYREYLTKKEFFDLKIKQSTWQPKYTAGEKVMIESKELQKHIGSPFFKGEIMEVSDKFYYKIRTWELFDRSKDPMEIHIHEENIVLTFPN